MPNKTLAMALSTAALFMVDSTASAGDLEFFDLTHPIPTFEPLEGDLMKPDLSKPVGNSRPIAGFYHQAVLYPVHVWPTSEGQFESTAILIQEHNGTSFNTPNHYINNAKSFDEGSIPNDQRRATEDLTISDLTGPVVMIDVSARVERELRKNGGRPSPDTSVTNFSDTSQATVRASDIDAVADQIKDGVWIVANLGWSQFYGLGGEDWDAPGYVNGLNHPGFTEEALDRLIEIMDEKNVRISGIATDSLSGDSGDGVRGSSDDWSDSWPAHVKLFQRDILIVENLANVGNLSAASTVGDCSLVVGALKHVGGTGGPARVIGVCTDGQAG